MRTVALIAIPLAVSSSSADAQGNAWRSISDDRPFTDDSIACRTRAIRTVGSDTAQTYPKEFWGCAYARNWRSIRIRPVDPGCVPVGFSLVSDRPAGIPDARIDSLLADLRTSFTRRYIPDRNAEPVGSRIKFSLALENGEGNVANNTISPVGSWSIGREVELALQGPHPLPAIRGMIVKLSLDMVMILNDRCFPYEIVSPPSQIKSDTYPPIATEVFVPPMPIPASLHGFELVAEFDIDASGKTLTVRFAPSADARYNKKLQQVLEAIRFRPATTLDGKPIRDTAILRYRF